MSQHIHDNTGEIAGAGISINGGTVITWCVKSKNGTFTWA